MESRSRHLLRTLLKFLLIVVIGVTLSLYAFASVLAYDTVSLQPPHVDRATPTGTFETVSFPSRGQSYPVYGFLLPGEPHHPAIIVAHGYKGSRYLPDELARAADYRNLDYTVLSIDLSDNAGDTVGNGRISMGFSERWDILGAFDYLLTRGFGPDQIGLSGFSMGAATVILAAGAEGRIRAVWADSAYERADTVIAEQAVAQGITPLLLPGGMLAGWLISGDRIWEAAPIDTASDLAAHHQAVYLVQCQDDGTVPIHHGIDLYNAFQAAGVAVTFWHVESGNHGEAITLHHDEYMQRLDAFFKANLRMG
jgi:dipeptidyl aminopeptidase/acylaminoacyl peptidase